VENKKELVNMYKITLIFLGIAPLTYGRIYFVIVVYVWSAAAVGRRQSIQTVTADCQLFRAYPKIG
jgi:hypothetical protein